MKGKKIYMKTWMKENRGKLFEEEDAKLVEKILSKGTTFHCRVTECSHKWKGKPKEVYLICPKCGKSVVGFHLKYMDKKTTKACRTTDWNQEDM